MNEEDYQSGEKPDKVQIKGDGSVHGAKSRN
jgi:hypothetical protein